MVDFQGRYDIPYTNPMVYSPTFTIKSYINVGKYTIHGSFGIYVAQIDFRKYLNLKKKNVEICIMYIHDYSCIPFSRSFHSVSLPQKIAIRLNLPIPYPTSATQNRVSYHASQKFTDVTASTCPRKRAIPDSATKSHTMMSSVP